jgi:RecB family endonuclease NucS
MTQFPDSNSLQQALLKGMVIVINARCSIEYSGRASYQASEEWRLIIMTSSPP